jgi:alcohol dehydrogenase YqhD (iron-dependent ADH family)
MTNFTYVNPARIIFGRGTEREVGRQAALYGKRVLLHYGGGSIRASGLYDVVMSELKKAGLTVVDLGGVKPNPRLSLVREGIRLCRKEKIDLILAVGGGSVIDSSKGIACGTVGDGDIWDRYLGTPPTVERALPVGVVLTLPAAGSETSNGSVVTNEQTSLKRYITGECLIPRFAIMNPELTYSLPNYQTACGASDIMAHLFERYFTNETGVDCTDRLIEGALKTIMHYAPIALRDNTSYDARAQIMWIGNVAHNGLLDTGRIGDWASHDIEHELSGVYDIAHGAGLSIVVPAWMKFVHSVNIDRFVQLAVRVFDVDFDFCDRQLIVLEMIRRLESFYVSIGMPVRLAEAGIPSDRLREMSKNALLGRTSVGNLKRLGEDDVFEILKLAM